MKKIILISVAIGFMIVYLQSICFSNGDPSPFGDVNEMTRKLKTAVTGEKNLLILHLGWSGKPEALEPLLNILNNEEEDIIHRRLSAESLGYLGNTTAIPYLKETMKSEDEELKRNSAGSLVYLGEKDIAYPVLQDLIESGVHALEYLIMRKNGGIISVQDEHAESMLIDALDNDNDRIRTDASLILIRIDNKNIIKFKETFFKLSIEVYENKKDSAAMSGALGILARIGDDKATQILIKWLEETESYRWKDEIRSALHRIEENEGE